MNISILTVFPEIFGPFLATSLVKKAQEKKLVSFDVTSYFSFVKPKERIDAPTCGHGSGMLIKPRVVEDAIASQDKKHGKSFRIFFSPQGKKLDQPLLEATAKKIQSYDHVILASSRYEGMDARVEQEYADLVISVGDFVVMGGDIPAMLFLEGLLRHIPGVIGRKESVEQDSFSGPFVDYPEFTEPVEWRGKKVPDVVLSGNHAELQKWRESQAAYKTIKEHFDWFRTSPMTEHQKNLGKSCIPSHYAVLMHSDVIVDQDRVGTTSITSLDIHDIARSARTYGLDGYFLVSPLKDQQQIAQTLLDFWQEGKGVTYNAQRAEALASVALKNNLSEVLMEIEAREGKKPLIIATSAREVDHPSLITYYDQGDVWSQERPVLLVFGTGRGLAPEVVASSDYLLLPVAGFTEFNHLSVRSAVAVIFDRWLGWNRKRI
ncbi:tRNA (guanosine(37)-N1)-methyltransferase TrmD [Candidatus Babeliales bacterium]|nr:tRNA (guanosine(37)-N1)-methyltransferase TrmD [Candidatus Babeliales bacterium]